MKTKVLVLSLLAACAGTAAAQSTSKVEIYGRINTSVEVQKTTGQASTVGLVNDASRWGIKGSEDLGQGMSAFFQLESGFESDTGKLSNNGGIFNREAFMGLGTKLGTVRFGRITSPVYFASADYISLHNHDTGNSSDALFGFAATGVNNNNSVTYKTPSFAGGDIEVAYSFAAGAPWDDAKWGSEQPGSSNNQRNAQIAYNAVFGALHVGAGYAQMEDPTVGGTDGATNSTAVIRGMYEAGPFILGAYYERSKLYVKSVADERSRNNLRMVGAYLVGDNEFHLNIGRAGDFSGLDDSGATQWTVGYNYNLSKRTRLYTFYTEVKADDKADYAMYPVGHGDKYSSYGLGLRHNF
ncbi:MAG: porin [Burkholderiaceae bacterium]